MGSSINATNWALHFSYRSRDGRFSLQARSEWRAQATGLYGISGSGKSTLLEILAGVCDPINLTGTAKIDDKIIFDTTQKFHLPPAQRMFAWAPQSHALFPHMSVEQNCLYAYPDKNTPTGSLRSPERVFAALHLQDCLSRLPKSLSGGERQRVSLARALLSMRPILLLDEPLSSLDTALKQDAMDCIRLVRDEFAVSMIYVSHDMGEIRALCDDIRSIRSGRLERFE